jgi:hypothetical protein
MLLHAAAASNGSVKHPRARRLLLNRSSAGEQLLNDPPKRSQLKSPLQHCHSPVSEVESGPLWAFERPLLLCTFFVHVCSVPVSLSEEMQCDAQGGKRWGCSSQIQLQVSSLLLVRRWRDWERQLDRAQ